MQPARITCDGVTVSSWDLPPFQLRPGDLICLHLNGPAETADEAVLRRALTGKDVPPGILLFGRAMDVTPAAPRHGFPSLFGQPTLAAWLSNHGGVPVAEATRHIEEMGLQPSEKLTRVAGTPRLLLALTAAWNRQAEAVVFSLTGLDPLGKETVINAVRAHLDRCPAILLSYPYTTNGETRRFCPEGSQCLESRHSAAA
jgi:hypothetical protein